MNRAARAALLVIAEDLQLDGEVDLANLYPAGTDNTTGAVENAGDTGGDQEIGGVLGRNRRSGDDTDVDAPVGHDLRQFVDGARARLHTVPTFAGSTSTMAATGNPRSLKRQRRAPAGLPAPTMTTGQSRQAQLALDLKDQIGDLIAHPRVP